MWIATVSPARSSTIARETPWTPTTCRRPALSWSSTRAAKSCTPASAGSRIWTPPSGRRFRAFCAERRVEQQCRRLRFAREVHAKSAERPFATLTHGEELSERIPRERRIETQCAVGSEGPPRGRKREPAFPESLMQRSQRAVRVQGQHDDLTLEESHWTAKAHRDR